MDGEPSGWFDLGSAKGNGDSAISIGSSSRCPSNGARTINCRFPCHRGGYSTSTGNRGRTRKIRSRRGLPICLLLLQSDSSGDFSGSSLSKCFSHNFCICRTNIGGISSLTALFQLGGEHRDSDSHQHGPQGLRSMDTVKSPCAIENGNDYSPAETVF